VQQILEKALSDLFQMEIETVGCGRTDTGVHATEFFAHADLPSDLDPAHVVYKLNKMLPYDVAIDKVLRVREGGHARFDAVKRIYEYRVSRIKDPFNAEFSYYYYGMLDVDKMNECANLLPSFNDFSCFSKSNTQVNNNLCTIDFAGWVVHDHQYIFTISANRFLRNMVRAIVGTLLEVGKGKMDKEGFIKVIEGKNRSDAGTSVPAQGLFLKSIQYPEGVIVR
jgi:tRNA pseudouridine38-40 synthase